MGEPNDDLQNSRQQEEVGLGEQESTGFLPHRVNMWLPELNLSLVTSPPQIMAASPLLAAALFPLQGLGRMTPPNPPPKHV